MPIIDFHVTEASTHIIDPIVSQVIDAVLADLNVTHYFKDSIYKNTYYTGASLSRDAQRRLNISGDRCDVTIEPAINPVDLKWDSNTTATSQAYAMSVMHKDAYRPLFLDKIADVTVTEHHIPCKLTLEFALSFKNREAADNTLSTLINKYTGAAIFNPHDVVYSYPVDMALATAIYTIFKLRTSETEKNFVRYMQKYTAQAVTFEVSRHSMGHPTETPNKELVIKRQHLNCMGLLEFNQPKPETTLIEKLPDRFVINFTYTLQFSRPDSLRMYFPCVVENQLVPDYMVATIPKTYQKEIEGLLHERSFNVFIQKTRSQHPPLLIRLPEYDDFIIPPCSVKDYKFHSFLIAGILLDPLVTNIDLRELGDIKLHPVALEILSLHTAADLFGTTAIFNVSVFCNDFALDRSCLSFIDGHVVSIDANQVKKRYHFVLSEATDISNLDPKWVPILIKYQWFFPITIIRNLDKFIDKGKYVLDPGHELLNIIELCMRLGKLDGHIKTIIEQGHTDSSLYQYATTSQQFAAYICRTKSLIDQSLYLFDVFATLGLQVGCITRIPPRYLETEDGYPISPNKGGFNGYNLPLRIFNVIINTDR